MSGDPKLSRGYRNRNPGNIEHLATNKWLGLETPPSDGRFCRFRSHQHGIRALAVLLQSYQDRHGLRTVRGIVARWAPSSAACRRSRARWTSATGSEPSSRPPPKLKLFPVGPKLWA